MDNAFSKSVNTIGNNHKWDIQSLDTYASTRLNDKQGQEEIEIAVAAISIAEQLNSDLEWWNRQTITSAD